MGGIDLVILAAGANDPLRWYFMGGVIAFVAGWFIIAHFQQQKRCRELLALATAKELFFAPDADNAHTRFGGFEPLDNHRHPSSSNLLHGRRGEIEWLIFDFQYVIGAGKNKRTHRFGVVAAIVPLHFRRLTIRPEGFLDKMQQFVTGSADIPIQNEPFNRRYHVTCDVPKFAHDVLHPQMIELLMAGTPMHWQLGGDVILIHRRGLFTAEEIDLSMLLIEAFIDRLPDELIERMSQPEHSEFPLRPAI